VTARPGGPVRPRSARAGAGERTRPRPTPAASAQDTSTAPGAAAGGLAAWATTAARVLLGAVLAWFGYHELVAPRQWTGYVPVLRPSSSLAQVLVLAHGWVLLVLAAALLAGIAPRLAAAASAVLLTEIVLSLIAAGGLSDLVLRDVGVLGLSLALVGAEHQRLVLRQ